MALDSLPSEILSHIFSFAGDPQPTDGSLSISAEARQTLLDASLTCRRVSIHSQLALFREVRFEVQQRVLLPSWAQPDSDGSDGSDSDEPNNPDRVAARDTRRELDAAQDERYLHDLARLEAFARVCAANHMLRDAVKKLQVKWEMDLNEDHDWELSVLEVLMSNINPSAQIHIEILSHWRGPREPPTHRYLRDARALEDRRCEIVIQRDPFNETSLSIQNSEAIVTSVKASHRPLHIDVLERVLSPNLGPISLTAQIPGDNSVVNRKKTRWSSRRAYDMHERLSPAQIQKRCLDKIRKSITSLDLNSYASRLAGGHDGSRFDLQSFDALTRLEIDGDLIFGSAASVAGEAGKNLCSRLPPNLHDLRILFPRGQGIFWSLPMVRKMSPSAVDQLINSTLVLDEGRTALSWLSEILENKESKLPNLESVLLEEEDVSGPWNDYRIIKWSLPGWLRQKAEACGMHVGANFRVPSGARILPDWTVDYEFEMLDHDATLDTDHEYDEYY